MDARPYDIRDLATLARERVQIGSAPDWIAPCPYDADFKPKVRGPLTHLLIEQQVQAELHETYVRTAVRLESMQAVQHQSQWRLEFEPQTQSVRLHSIKIRRASHETEHASLDRIQYLQREAGLEGCVIDGGITLLLLLEDVRPGDVLESSYTVTSRPRLLPECVTCFFTLPPGVAVGKYHFSVRHAPRRDLRWKTSSQDLTPTIGPEGLDVRCLWSGERISSPEPEPYTPIWQIDQPWIQVSDCPDWQTVARAVLDTWKEDFAGEGLSGLVEEVKSLDPDLLTRIHRAIELVQDRFRYLSVNLELGGTIPAPAETVIRRRYGDCKDLAFLLVRLLRMLGVTARPVLVHAMWRQSITRMLPSPGVFNHVVVEFQWEKERRWVDVTMKGQGGGALKRCVPDFGLGLPIAADTLTLVPVPAASLASGTYEVKESFILDTAGSPSWLAILVTAKGVQAEALRLEFENEGAEAIAKKRLQMCADRFSRAARIGSLEYRDDRQLNEFVLAEAFEIEGFLKREGDYDTCLIQIQSGETAGLLMCPGLAERRNPFALPHPCHQVHTVEIDFVGLDVVTVPLYQAGNAFFSFSRRCKSLPKFFRVIFSFNTLADSVPANRVPDHRRQVEPVWQAAALQIRLPMGYPRMRKPGDFGALPPLPRTVPGSQRPASTAPVRVETPAVAAGEVLIKPTVESPQPARPVEKRAFIDPAAAVTAPDRRRSRSSNRSRSGGQRYSRGYRSNRRCLLSFFIFLGAIAAFMVSVVLSRMPDSREMSGLILLVAFAAVLGSVVLAGFGLRQCALHPDRYSSGKGIALATIVCGVLFGAMLIPILAMGINEGTASTKSRNRTTRNNSGLLKFDTLNFVFRPPGPPWSQADARIFGRGTVLAFARDEPMFFTVTVNPLERGSGTSREFAEVCKAIVRRDMTSCRLLNEEEATLNGHVGWQTETQAAFQGREYYLVHWLLAENGLGYQLVTWGPPEFKSQVKEEAERLFLNFETTQR